MAEPVPPAPTPNAPQKRKLSSLLVVWSFTRRYRLQLLIAIVALVGSSVTTLLIPRTFKQIIDHGFAAGADISRIGIYFEGLLLVVLALAVFTAMRFYFVSWLAERTVADLRVAVQRNLLRLPPKWFEENRPSEIASRLTADTAIVEQVVGSTVSMALRNLLTGTGGVIYLFALSPKIAAYLIVGIPITILPIFWLGSRVRSMSRNSQDRVADVGSIASETLGAMRIVQAFGQEQREGERFEDAVTRTFEAGKRRFGLRAMMTALVIGALFSAITLIMWAAVADVAAGTRLGRLDHGVRDHRGPGHRLVQHPDRSLWRSAARFGRRQPPRRAAPVQEPDIAPPANPVALPQPAAGRHRHSITSRSAIPTRPEVSALSDFSLDVRIPARRWQWSAPRAPASRRSSSSSSASTIRIAARSVSTACRSGRPTRPRSARAWRWCRRIR
jgi:ATP-binding cassette subfamily B protein